ncbi:hypothetical protein BU17DRAFT_63793 [Hysterangium stoloniferum]|nr:hypothetical protein BU17DRAFT_63793 [Hysterangium stoloniferum]
MVLNHKFQPKYLFVDQLRAPLTIHHEVGGFKFETYGSPISRLTEICVATTVVIGKMPLSFRELHRSGATSYCHNIDPGIATFRSETQAENVIIHLREILICHEKHMVHPVPYMKIRALFVFGSPRLQAGDPGYHYTGTKVLAIQNYRAEYRVPMLSGMIRDSMIYFASIFAALLVNCTIYYPKNHVEVQITVVPIGDYAFQMDKYHILHDGIPPEFNRFDRLSAHQSGEQLTTDPAHR